MTVEEAKTLKTGDRVRIIKECDDSGKLYDIGRIYTVSDTFDGDYSYTIVTTVFDLHFIESEYPIGSMFSVFLDYDWIEKVIDNK